LPPADLFRVEQSSWDQSPPSPCATAPDADTLALYTFEDAPGTSTIKDLIGQHHGTLHGTGASRITGLPGCGSALAFPGGGSNQAFAAIPDHPAWDLAQGSVDLWLRVDSVTQGQIEGVLSRDAHQQASNGHITIGLSCGGVLVVRLQTTTASFVRCAEVTLGQWHHLGVNFGGPDSLELFLDGHSGQFLGDVEFGATCITSYACGGATAAGIDGNDNPWVLGAASVASTEGTIDNITAYFHGAVDSLRISKARRAFDQ
jgi:hypothetical protein